MIKRVIISVYDKTGLEELVKTLNEYQVEIICSGGTARRIKEIGCNNLIEVSQYTGFPESPSGLVKTLHPRIHGGILLDRESHEHIKWMKENKIKPIDMIVSNLYPFEKVIAEGSNQVQALSNIDIGGPTLTRSAAKASLLYDKICIATDPAQYPEIINTLKLNNGELTPELRKRYALKAFKKTKDYDEAIVKYLEVQ
jgi:phosphoribosylaminoimidazolecarboxamide formyltransferase/IMP cyclohydrolase